MPVTQQPSIQVWPATPSTVAGSPCISDGEEPSNNEESASSSSSKKKRWADLVSDEDATPTNQIASTTQVNEKKRWADLSEDEAEAVTSPSNKTSQEISTDNQQSLHEENIFSATPEGDRGIEKKTADTDSRRPQFSRPSRETRTRQLRMKLDECFELNFDAVDPSQQDGLTHRMLVTLKSLAECISFWTLDGEQVTEEAFHLCNLE